MLRFGLGFAIALGAPPRARRQRRPPKAVVAAGRVQSPEYRGAATTKRKRLQRPSRQWSHRFPSARRPRPRLPRRPRPTSGRRPRSTPPRRVAPPPSRASTPSSATKPPIKEGECGTPAPIRLVAPRQGHLHASRPDQLRHARAAQHLDHQGPAAARSAPARRQDHQDRGDERLLLPHRLRPRRQEAQRARLRRRARYPRLRHRQEPGRGTCSRLGRHQPRHRRRGSRRQGAEEKLAQAQADAAKAGQDNLRDRKPGTGATPAPTRPLRRSATPGSGLVKSTRADGVDKVTVILPAAARAGSAPPASAAPTTSAAEAEPDEPQAAHPAALRRPPRSVADLVGARRRPAAARALPARRTRRGLPHLRHDARPGSQRGASQPLPRRHGRTESDKKICD